jgi:hypothetical protein
MKKFTYALTAVAMTGLMAGPAMAASATNSAVGIVSSGDLAVLNASNVGAGPILHSSIKTSEQKDLVMGVSLECGLYTRTKVSGQKGQKSTADGQAKVEVAVILDYHTPNARTASPGWVTFCEREQELSATLGGVLEECDVTLNYDPVTGELIDGSFTKDDCIFSDEDIQLMLRTMSANHFNFILTNVGTNGSEGHTIDVVARVTSSTSGSTVDDEGNPITDNYEAEANATLGNGSLVVDEVRLGQDILLDDGSLK